MDWSAAIEINREALKRILAMLVAMAGLADGQSAIDSRQSGSAEADGSTKSDCLLPTADCRPRLPRHLHRAVLRLLRPAKSAARRLIIAAARGLVVSPSHRRWPCPKPATAEPLLRRFGIAVVVSPADLQGSAVSGGQDAAAARPRCFSLPLFDTLPQPFRCRRRYVPAHAVPRILFPGVSEPFSLPPPPSPDDPIDAARLGRRLAALATVLDDLPGHARRFARWKASRGVDAAAGAPKPETRAALAHKTRRFRRVSPLRPGRPPGGRLSRYDPTATHPRKIREVDEILAHAHALAVCALEAPDTS